MIGSGPVVLERLLIVSVVAGAAWGVASLLGRRQLARASRASRRAHGSATTPAIVYFWSDGCSACKRLQRPILDRVVAEWGEERVAFTAYRVEDAPELAEEWGVRTLPTTFVLDPAGVTRHVNNGVIGAEQLREQLRRSARSG